MTHRSRRPRRRPPAPRPGPPGARPLSILLLSAGIAACAGGGPGAGETPSPREGGGAGEEGPRPYAEVITAEAVSDPGLFVVHRVGGKRYFEIPDSILGREILWVSRIARVPAGMGGYIPAGYKAREQVVRFERRGDEDRILLRKLSYAAVADESEPIHLSVVKNNFPPIVEAWDAEAIGPDSATVVVDVTEFFTSDVRAISGLSSGQRREYEVRRLDGDRTFVERIGSYPLNVEVRHTLTYEAGAPPSDRNTGTISMEMSQSLIVLPEEPMRPRHADPRVGWFTVSHVNYGLDRQKAATETFIRRWRLEPADPAAYARGELVEPVEPIVYYVDPATPPRWRPYVKQGIEDWQAAFESAGFRNAIVAKDPPSPEEDPDWSGEDVRHSVVRWAASTTRNAMGPSVSDPRTGEIIESDIVWFHNHMRSYRNRLMLETGASNPLARSLPIDQELMGEAMRQVIAHEVGHALGLPHNMIASSGYPVDSLRSPDFAARMGVAPTIMDYARQNYIAQPGDGLEGADYIRQIGPYDDYAIEWGYRVIPDAEAPDDEKPVLDAWILEHAGDPVYRYAPQRGGPAGGVNPDAQTEDLGDDPVRASGYGIANLKRVLPRLPEWTATPGEDWSDLEELYGELVGQWRRYIGHVVTVVGGVRENLKATDQEGPVYTPVSGERQRDAVHFLTLEVFETPAWLDDPEILRRIEYTGGVDRIRRVQVRTLEAVLDPGRLQRMTESAIHPGEGAYTPAELVEDLHAAVWRELGSGEAVDAYRRNLQRGHLEILASLLTEQPPELPDIPFLWRTPVDVSQSDVAALARAELRAIREEARGAIPGVDDPMSRIHLEDVVARIDAILDDGGGE